jgi:hypothetical protein
MYSLRNVACRGGGQGVIAFALLVRQSSRLQRVAN